MSKTEFHLFMRNDSNGTGSLQWFAFRMRNSADFTGSVKIVIANFTKAHSLFNEGMQPSFFSEKAFAKHKKGWF